MDHIRSNFADRLLVSIRRTGTPAVVGLDPRLELMPHFITKEVTRSAGPQAVQTAIATFNELVLDVVADLVPAVKPQIAFYEQYGLAGLAALVETIAAAKRRGLLVILDAKRNDISSTADAYARAFLGDDGSLGSNDRSLEVDAITISPYLGRDSLAPFVSACERFGKGVFILVKTSNAGSGDLQDAELTSGLRVSERVAQLVDEMGVGSIGEFGYSSIGAVVGATFPGEATRLRAVMPRALILVPGYGAQGGTARDAVQNFNRDGLGAVVNSSRGITYAYANLEISETELRESIRRETVTMVNEIRKALSV